MNGNRTTAIQKSVLRNRSLTGAPKGINRQLARSNFRGQFAGKHIGDPRWARFHRRHVFVIGWFGPLFWPYAYDDFIDYTFWPYAYDTFWPYAYDDVYVSLFGPYAYAGSAYASAPAYREGGRVQRVPAGGVAQICSAEGTGLTDWPIEQITQTVEPNDRQRARLDELKNATASAVERDEVRLPERSSRHADRADCRHAEPARGDAQGRDAGTAGARSLLQFAQRRAEGSASMRCRR